MSSSRRVFLRSYLAVALFVLCSGMVLEWLLETHDAELKQISHSDLMRGSFVLAQHQLTATADEAAIKQVAQSLEAELADCMESESDEALPCDGAMHLHCLY